MSLFWWNLLPQNWQGYGRVSEWISKWVDRVEDLLKLFPHCLHSNVFSEVWTERCWLRLTSWPKVLLHNSHANGRFPEWDLRAWTSSPWGVLNILSHFTQLNTIPSVVPSEGSMVPIAVPLGVLRNGWIPWTGERLWLWWVKEWWLRYGNPSRDGSPNNPVMTRFEVRSCCLSILTSWQVLSGDGFNKGWFVAPGKVNPKYLGNSCQMNNSSRH